MSLPVVVHFKSVNDEFNERDIDWRRSAVESARNDCSYSEMASENVNSTHCQQCPLG